MFKAMEIKVTNPEIVRFPSFSNFWARKIIDQNKEVHK